MIWVSTSYKDIFIKKTHTYKQEMELLYIFGEQKAD